MQGLTQRLLDAVAHMHAHGISHRDLKLENLVLGRPGDLSTVTIVDFGLAKAARARERMEGVTGTLWYTAPEVLRGVPYAPVVDLWSVGVVLYLVLTGMLLPACLPACIVPEHPVQTGVMQKWLDQPSCTSALSILPARSKPHVSGATLSVCGHHTSCCDPQPHHHGNQAPHCMQCMQANTPLTCALKIFRTQIMTTGRMIMTLMSQTTRRLAAPHGLPTGEKSCLKTSSATRSQSGSGACLRRSRWRSTCSRCGAPLLAESSLQMRGGHCELRFLLRQRAAQPAQG